MNTSTLCLPPSSCSVRFTHAWQPSTMNTATTSSRRLRRMARCLAPSSQPNNNDRRESSRPNKVKRIPENSHNTRTMTTLNRRRNLNRLAMSPIKIVMLWSKMIPSLPHKRLRRGPQRTGALLQAKRTILLCLKLLKKSRMKTTRRYAMKAWKCASPFWWLNSQSISMVNSSLATRK